MGMQVFAFVIAILGFAAFVGDAIRSIERRLQDIGLALITLAVVIQLVVVSTNVVAIH